MSAGSTPSALCPPLTGTLALLVIGSLSNLACSQGCHENPKEYSLVADWKATGQASLDQASRDPLICWPKSLHLLPRPLKTPWNLILLLALAPGRHACRQPLHPALQGILVCGEASPQPPFDSCKMPHASARLPQKSPGLSTAHCLQRVLPVALSIGPRCVCAPLPHKLHLSFQT